MMNKRVFFMTLVALMTTACGQDLTWDSYRDNRDGVALLKAENYAGASEKFTQGLAESPYLAELHLNFGLALRGLQKPDEAMKSYQNAELVSKDDLTLFASRFNLGEAAGKAKKIDEALAWYQKALQVSPDSAEVKTNIELLLNGQGGGEGENEQKQDKPQDGKGDQKKDPKEGDQKDENKDGEGKDQEKDKEGKEDKPKEYQGNKKYQPRPFKGELSEADVKKILGEIRQQEQKIRSEFSRKEAKERPRDKDW